MATCQELLVLIQNNAAAQIVLDQEVEDAQQAADENMEEGIDLWLTYELQCGGMSAAPEDFPAEAWEVARRKIARLGGRDAAVRYLEGRRALYTDLTAELT